MSLEILVAAAAGMGFFIPAYAANPSAVLFGGGRPVDGGRVWGDGRRMLGDGKTWRGTIGGGACGLLLGLILASISHITGFAVFSFGGWQTVLVASAALSFGSMFGDIAGSFLKRRIGRERGSRTPILDQYDFMAGSLLFIILVDKTWFAARYWDGNGWAGLGAILVLTPILHRVVNIIGYKMGKKDVPW